MDECELNPCYEDGGECINTVGSFKCECKPGFKGKYCMELVNECDPDPCLNGATCLDDVGFYTCVCMPGMFNTD